MTPARKVLIADDDASIRLVLSQAFTRAGYEVRATGALSTLLKWVQDGEGDVVVSDVIMPDDNIFKVLPTIRKLRPTLPVIIMSAQNTLLTAVSAAETGAFEYLPKPFDLDAVVGAAGRALARGSVPGQAQAQARAVKDERLPLIGRSTAMQEIYRTIARLVATELTVLVQGESGTGKELAARALHDLGRRRDGRFVVIHLAATPRERVESELFGQNGEPGKLVEADGGTLFLDEIGDLPLDAQTRLLRVIDGSERPLNPRTGRKTDARLIAATNRDLHKLIRQGLFREDLFFRLNVAPLNLPPLRDRLDDIGDLARAFLLRAHREGLPAKSLDSGAVERLKRHAWPGNVRELENLMRRLAVLARDEVVDADTIQAMLGAPLTGEGADLGIATAVRALIERIARERPGALDDGTLYDRVIGEVERPLIEVMLGRHGQNQLRAARAMGINRNTLRKRLDSLGIDPASDRATGATSP